MLSNAYFLAKFRFDTAENKPAKNLQNFRKMHFSKMHFRKCIFRKCIFENALAEKPRSLVDLAGSERVAKSPAGCAPALTMFVNFKVRLLAVKLECTSSASTAFVKFRKPD